MFEHNYSTIYMQKTDHFPEATVVFTKTLFRTFIELAMFAEQVLCWRTAHAAYDPKLNNIASIEELCTLAAGVTKAVALVKISLTKADGGTMPSGTGWQLQPQVIVDALGSEATKIRKVAAEILKAYVVLQFSGSTGNPGLHTKVKTCSTDYEKAMSEGVANRV